ncbi:hypothetical protein L484_018672 [Morus notabilis]|uniref:Uncharacterized protein n=1 Tax=Morus notabilis TaxID=981085 RepID=W9S792_9ROSA|nr:hypothetical protein L484_018672 [Morus notabilis]
MEGWSRSYGCDGVSRSSGFTMGSRSEMLQTNLKYAPNPDQDRREKMLYSGGERGDQTLHCLNNAGGDGGVCGRIDRRDPTALPSYQLKTSICNGGERFPLTDQIYCGGKCGARNSG